jgi:hypothetical protein
MAPLLPSGYGFLQELPMSDRTNENDKDKKDGSAAERAPVSDEAQPDSHHTEAGQEATRGIPPGKHDREHQSNYGGGGANGGSDSMKQ